MYLLSFFFQETDRGLYLKGERVTARLVYQLQRCRDTQSLVKNQKKLQSLFDELVTVMIAFREYHHKQGQSGDLKKKNNRYSHALKAQLTRIYHLEGGPRIIEKAQSYALRRLDSYENRLKKRKEYQLRRRFFIS